MSATRLSGAMRRNILLLALSQAAVMTSISLVLASSVVIGVSLATPALATLPLAMQYLGTMLVLYPMARLIARYGQRPVFIGGALFLALSAWRWRQWASGWRVLSFSRWPVGWSASSMLSARTTALPRPRRFRSTCILYR